jgi:hypothetical protein
MLKNWQFAMRSDGNIVGAMADKHTAQTSGSAGAECLKLNSQTGRGDRSLTAR